MPVIFLTIILCLFNVFMWIIMLKRFKKMFSTDDIIASTRDELNKMIEDMNRNTGRDLSLADAKIKELKSVIAEAERRIGTLNSDLTRQVQNDEFKATLETRNDKTQSSGYFSTARSPVEHYVKNQSVQTIQPSQGSQAFEQVSSSVEKSVPEITYAENQIQPKADLAQQVRRLYEQGVDVEFIASSLNTTTTEVQLIIDMNF